MQILLKRGNQKIETQQLADFTKGVAQINETLSLQTNIYEVNGIYQEKKAQLTVVIITDKGNKAAGQCQLDFSTYLNQNKYDISEQFHLDKCPDKHAKIFTKIKFIQLGEIDFETISQASEITVEQVTDKKQQILTPDKQLTESTAKKNFCETKQITNSCIDNSNSKIQPKTPLVSDIESAISLQSQFLTQNQLNNDELNESRKLYAEIKDQNYQLSQEIQMEKAKKEQLLIQVHDLIQQQDQNLNNNQYQVQILFYEKQLSQIQTENENLTLQNKISLEKHNNLKEELNTLKQIVLFEKNKTKSLQDKLKEIQDREQQKELLNSKLNSEIQEATKKMKEQDNYITQLNQKFLELNQTVDESNIQIIQHKGNTLQYQQNTQLFDQQSYSQGLQVNLKNLKLDQQEIEAQQQNQIKINQILSELKDKEDIIRNQGLKLQEDEQIIEKQRNTNQGLLRKIQEEQQKCEQQIEQNKIFQTQLELQQNQFLQEKNELKQQINGLQQQMKLYQEKISEQSQSKEVEDILYQNKQQIQEQQMRIDQQEEKIKAQIDQCKERLDQQNQLHKLELQELQDKSQLRIQQMEEEVKIWKENQIILEEKSQNNQFQQNQLQNFQLIIEELRLENNKVIQEKQELENYIRNQKQNVISLNKQNQEQQEMIQQKQKQIVVFQEKMNETNNIISKLESENKLIKGNLTNDLQELQQQLFSENDEWQKEKEILQKQVEEHENNKVILFEQLKEKELQLSKIQEQNLALKSQNQLLNEIQLKVQDLDKENRSNKLKWQHQVDEINKDYNLQVENLTKQVESLEQQIQEHKQEKDNLKRLIIQKDDDIQLREEKNKLELQSVTKNYNMKIREKEDIIEQMKADILQYQQNEFEQSNLIKFLESAKENLEKLQKENYEYTKRIQLTNEKQFEQIKEYEQKIIFLNGVIKELEQKRDQLEIEISNQQLNNQHTVIENDINEKVQETSDQQIEQLQEEIISLKCRIGDMLNTASDIGGSKLVDRLQCALGIKE
ncbi:unnamed protein product [Paramecium sonneborni]|uniref:C2 NT-type domain-containing protein n=1 Tax=Paramecium sonneborni TaxID=65129 RepID=A0A8S1N4B9_9CILI|nr:unnamed protein product [Paramecium sonneborni]